MMSRRSLLNKQDYNKIRNDCLKSGKLFVDEFFKHDIPGVNWIRPKDIVKDPRFFVGGASRFDVIQGDNSGCWLVVAMANLTMNPTLFNHVVPKDQSFTERYAGIFLFNIWQCGQWMEVVVDDQLPTRQGSTGSLKLKFLHSKEKNEFWSALLEKAYAKLYGSYKEISVGWFNEAMVDFTGGIVERVRLTPTPKNLGIIISKSLEKGSFICVFMVNDPNIYEAVLDNGLIKGHAYGITKAQTVSPGGRSVLLLRLRNPWGRNEWNGAWSDSSPEWKSIPDDEKKRLGLVREEDGEFWISFSDFSNNFENMDICHLTPDLYSNEDGKEKIGWESQSFKGEWTTGVNAGGFYKERFYLNPQYRIVLTDTDDDVDKLCTLIIGLLQKNKTREVWHKIGITAFHLEGPEKLSNKPLSKQYVLKNFKNSFTGEFKPRREVVVRDKWEPGVYCIVPHTYEPDEEARFLLRVYSEKKASMEEHETLEPLIGMAPIEQNEPIQASESTQTPKKNKLLKQNEQEVSEFFQRIAGNENEIGWHGLQLVLEYALTNNQSPDLASSGLFAKLISWLSSLFPGLGPSEKTTFTKDECRSMISIMDYDRTGRLSFTEFQVLWRKLQYWESVFANYSNKSDYMNATELSKALKEAGYITKTSDISRLVRKYSNYHGKLAFDDFVMCSIELLGTRTC